MIYIDLWRKLIKKDNYNADLESSSPNNRKLMMGMGNKDDMIKEQRGIMSLRYK